MTMTTHSPPIIEAENVVKRFGEQTVLQGIDFAVDEGEIVLLMGPNGVGKSVFVSCLTGATNPTDGRIRLFGEIPPIDARSAVSVMLQGAMTDPDLTGRQNLQFYQDLHPHGTDRWKQLIEEFELSDDIDRVVRDYSGGMKRKIEIAITLSADVPLYVLDEPTVELDLAMIRVLHDMLLELKEAGKTILITSHAPLDAQIADRIAFVQAGQIVANGTPSELLDGLPQVVRMRGSMPEESHVLGGRLFNRGDEIRGFLPDNTDIESVLSDLEDNTPDTDVDIDRPAYTDLFNYYTYIYPTNASLSE
jgi:ABC-2 type transport system ATP-binding protein